MLTFAAPPLILISALFLLLAVFTPVQAGGLDQVFETGYRAYLDGKFEDARDLWLQIVNQGYQSGALYYNLGNACFKTDRLGEAILYWEKASRLLGEDADLKFNLQIAKSRLVDRLDEEVHLPVWTWFDTFRAWFSVGFLIWSGVSLSFLIFALAGLRRWWMSGLSPRLWMLRFIWFLAALWFVDAGLLLVEARTDSLRREGVLMVREAEILSAPAEGTGKLLFTLHEGTKVKVLREMEHWFEISIGKNKSGWVKKGELVEI